jgi:HAD superfamily hydrolase (TIGR01509 family)
LLRGVLLDVDGTLVDSNAAHAQSWVDTLAEIDYEVSFDVVWPMIGMGGDKLLPSLAGIESDSPEGKRLSERRWEIFEREYIPRLRPTPGARDLVQRLSDDGLKLIVATSAAGHELGALLEAAGVADLMDGATSSSDAEDSKPDPDIVQAAVRKSRFDPDELIMIGDTPYDVQAAIGAHVKLVGLLCGGWSAQELSGAVAIYEHPSDLLHWYSRSPDLLSSLAG